MSCYTGSRMSLRMSTAVLCLLNVVHWRAAEGGPRGQIAELPQDIEQVLWWLPEETEAVVVSRGNVPVRDTSSTPSVTVGPGLRAPQMDEFPKYTCEDLVAMTCSGTLAHFYPDIQQQNEVLKAVFGPSTASLFVKAVWWDRNETRETCDIIVFRDNTASRIIETLAGVPGTPRSICGVDVLEVDFNSGWTGEQYDSVPFDLNALSRPLHPNPGYFAAPRRNVYVVATSSELLRVIFERMNRRGANRALPPELPEWRHLDPTVPAWGLRHYRAAIADKDPLSMVKWDPNAEGLVFFGGSTPSPFVCLRYVSKSEDAGSRFLRMKANWRHIRDIGAMLPMQRVHADYVETRLRINVPETEAKRDRWSLNIVATYRCLAVTYLPLLGFSCPELAMISE